MAMHVEIRTDNHIRGSDQLYDGIRVGIQSALKRYAEQLTRVEIHLADVNGPKGAADDKRCLIEARPRGLQPIVASHQAANLDDAVDGAADKLARALDAALGRLHSFKSPQPQPPAEAEEE